MPWTGGLEQQWWLVEKQDSSYVLVNAKSNRMLDSTSARVNAPIVQNGQNGNNGYAAHQLWRILTAQ